MAGIDTHQALNANDHFGEHSQLICRVHHCQSMTVLRSPDVDHIRLKILQLLRKESFQFKIIGVSLLFLKQRILRAVFQCAGSLAAKAQ